jgi:hypothetical protein
MLVIQFAAIQRDPDRVRKCVYEFLSVSGDFKPHLEAGKNEARAPRFPILQSGAQRLYACISAIPGVDKVLKSPAIAKMLQDTYHRLNSKARKYEPLAPEERCKWETYYAADQEELSRFLRNLTVIE